METAEAPQAVARMPEHNGVALAELGRLMRKRGPSSFVTCARGSSDYAASCFKHLGEIALGVPCRSVGASVVSIYGAHFKLRDSIPLTVSQSGQSPDLVAFQAEAKCESATLSDLIPRGAPNAIGRRSACSPVADLQP
jgi:glucosamine--fructose-6-phosphate aminotransferase (isomerizing)